ncbi:MAG: rod shape-determining protein MreD [Eggerthellaceae bacterium]|nr:rod shape-determining protein MreD [Eggerthellaceae bacterium]
MGGRVGIAAIGALLALVLQVVLAPNIAIMGTMPHFVIAYTMVVSLLVPGTPAYVVAFCLGMASDLLGYGPVGALPFILLIMAFAIGRAESAFGNGTVFVSCSILVVFVILAHFLHAAFMVAMTSTYSASEAFLLIAIPQSLYDSVLAVIMYIALRRMFSPSPSPGGIGSSGLRLR